MFKYFFIGFFVFIFIESGRAQTSKIDSIACRKIEDTLLILEKLVKNIPSDPHLYRISAVKLLTKLSGIPYEGSISVIGEEFPSEQYFIKCKDWYNKNKSRLVWDPTALRIYLRE